MNISQFNQLVTKKLRSLLYVLVDQCILSLPSTRTADGVVLIRPDGIGDFVIWLDAAQALTNFYRSQKKKVTLVANSTWSEWAFELGFFDQVIAIDIIKFDHDLRYRIAVARNFRSQGFALALQPIYSRHYLTDVVTRMCGSRERIGWADESEDKYSYLKRIRDRWYTHLVHGSPGTQMEIIRNADFVREVADPAYLGKMSDLRPSYSSLPDSSGLDDTISGGKFYVLFPGASWTGKRWPIQNFVELSQRIYDDTRLPGIICGSESDNVLADAICNSAHVPLISLSGRTDLSQLTRLFSHASLVISNDTAATHIAASVGTPTVCVLGGGHYGRFLPYQVECVDKRPLPLAAIHVLPCFNCDWKCIFPIASNCAAPCIALITIDTVWNLARQALGKKDL